MRLGLTFLAVLVAVLVRRPASFRHPAVPVAHLVTTIDRVHTPVLLVATTPQTLEVAVEVQAARRDLPIQVTYAGV